MKKYKVKDKDMRRVQPDTSRLPDAVANRISITISEHVWEELLRHACEIGYKFKGKYSVCTMLEAISEIETDELYNFMDQQRMLPQDMDK